MATTNIKTFDGSVGIGTNTTSYKFEVYDGSSRLEDTTITTVTSTDETDATDRFTAAVTVAGGMGVQKTIRCENAETDTTLSVGTTDTTNAVNINGTLKTTSITIGGITNAYVPSGAIAIWSGSTGSIPSGWVICDGNNSTPDLRNMFVLGSTGAPDHNTTGGSVQVTLTEDNLVQHAHGGETGNYDGHAHTGDTSAKAQHAHTGQTGNAGSHGHANSDTGQDGQHGHSSTTVGGGDHGHPVGDPGHRHQHTNGPSFNFHGIGKHGGTLIGTGSFINQANSGGTIDGATHQHGAVASTTLQHGHTGTTGNASAVHAHTLTAPSTGGHGHTFTYASTGAHEHTFTTGSAGQGQPFEVLPPYYALAYIMKI